MYWILWTIIYSGKQVFTLLWLSLFLLQLQVFFVESCLIFSEVILQNIVQYLLDLPSLQVIPSFSLRETSPFWRRSALGFLWKEWCWSWNSSTLGTSCEELTHWKRLWCWEGLWAGGEGDHRGWDGWMASLTWWTWVWVNSWVGDGQGGLACCGSWGRKELDMTERLIWSDYART